MINANAIELISNLGHIVSANDDVMKKSEIFIRTVLCNGKSKDTCVEIRVQMYNKQNKRIQSISLHPDPLSCKQAIRRWCYQSYHWLHCTDKIFLQLSLTPN